MNSEEKDEFSQMMADRLTKYLGEKFEDPAMVMSILTYAFTYTAIRTFGEDEFKDMLDFLKSQVP